jgi:four helix bundle protein
MVNPCFLIRNPYSQLVKKDRMKEEILMHWSKLKVWKETHDLVLKIYKITVGFPKTETYGLVDQLKRASYSVPANIVEGQSRNTTKEYLKFLFNSRGSLQEVRYFLLLSYDLKFISSDVYEDLENHYANASKMLNGLIKFLRSNSL